MYYSSEPAAIARQQAIGGQWRHGGMIEYGLPECATAGPLSNTTVFEVSVEIEGDLSVLQPCSFTYNMEKLQIMSKGWHRIGQALVPTLAPNQVVMLIESLAPTCQLRGMRLVPSVLQTHRPRMYMTAPRPSTLRPCWRAKAEEVQAGCAAGLPCAYVTLVLNDRFAVYAYALHKSLRESGSIMPLLVMCGEHMSNATMRRLEAHGMHTVRIGSVPYPGRYHAASNEQETFKSHRFTKLRAWRLTQYSKLVFLDSDTMVTRNIDPLFACEPGSAAADQGAPGNFNSGVFVLKPDMAVYAELLRLAPLLPSYNKGDQGFLNRAFSDWALHRHRQLPESYNYFLKWRGVAAWLSHTWNEGVHVVHFTDVVKPHNWFLYPTMQASHAPATASFTAQQGDMFQKWIEMADEYDCEVGGDGPTGSCNMTRLALRSNTCRAVASAFYDIGRRDRFSVILSHAPKRNRDAVLRLIESNLQQVPELHTIFLMLHGEYNIEFRPSGNKPIVQVLPGYDAIGNRFGPIRIPTDAVLIMDDDIIVDPRDLSRAFHVWNQASLQLVGTFARALHRDSNGLVEYGFPRRFPDGTHDMNVILTKLFFVHRHYLYMYTCLLPFKIWDMPNVLINCEDVLMNLIISIASGLPGIIYRPIFKVQSDYGTAPPTHLQGRVAGLTGLSSSRDEDAWLRLRVHCATALIHHFNNDTKVLKPIAVQATPPWQEVPFTKSFIAIGGGTIESNVTYDTRRQQDLFTRSIERGQRTYREKYLKASISPTLSPSENCPAREDVLNTPEAERWNMWNDPSCLEGCVLKHCNKGVLAPCCVRRLAARWSIPCERLPQGCPSQRPRAKAEYVVVDDKWRIPTIQPSSECPTREDVINTAPLVRNDMWNDASCSQGCRLLSCSASILTPACVRRQRAIFPRPCTQLPHGCNKHSRCDVVDDSAADGIDSTAGGIIETAAMREDRSGKDTCLPLLLATARFSIHHNSAGILGRFGRSNNVKLDTTDMSNIIGANYRIFPTASFELEVYVSDTAHHLTMIEFTQENNRKGLMFNVPEPLAGWQPHTWHHIVIPILERHYSFPKSTDWAAMDRMELYYSNQDYKSVGSDFIRIRRMFIRSREADMNSASIPWCVDVYRE